MADLDNPRQNHLLDTLPAAEYERLFPFLELVLMPLGEVLYESEDKLRYVYFPTTSIISIPYVMENGASADIAVVGNEGIIGVALFMGGGTMPNRAVVLSSGYAYRLRGHLLMQEFNRFGGRRNGKLHDLLLRYTQTLIIQMAQTAVCNRHHSIEQQLCRWLLLSLDRLPSNELTMTQELIASMLGVRRESVTEAAGKLQRAGLIDYHRSHITVLDRPGLEERVCECYQVVKLEFDRLLPSTRRESLTSRIPAVGYRESLKANELLLPLKGNR
jgi:CRP-like cAMP-binding protein